MDPLVKVSDDVYRWSAPSAGMPDLVGHAVLTGDGLVIFDPPASPGLVPALRELGPTRAILLTGSHHDRASGALRARLGMPPLHAPAEDVEALAGGGLLVDETFSPGDCLLGAWEAILLPEAPSFGREWAFFRRADRTLVLSDLIVFGQDTDRLYPDAFGQDAPREVLASYILRLLDLGPSRILAGHGDDVLGGAADRMRALLEGTL